MSERPKEHASKACEGSRPPWVQIPPLPPQSSRTVGAPPGEPGVAVVVSFAVRRSLVDLPYQPTHAGRDVALDRRGDVLVAAAGPTAAVPPLRAQSAHRNSIITASPRPATSSRVCHPGADPARARRPSGCRSAPNAILSRSRISSALYGSISFSTIGGRAAVVRHPYVQLLQVLGLSPVEPVLADTGNEVDVHHNPVAGGGVLPDERRRDVLHPVRHFSTIQE